MVVGGRELIDILWNVNQKRGSATRRGLLRINRNIVECKCQNGAYLSFSESGINRNIVECKYVL